jgi:hypothetical protein
MMLALGSSAVWRFMLRYSELLVFHIVGRLVRNSKTELTSPLMNFGRVQHNLTGATL